MMATKSTSESTPPSHQRARNSHFSQSPNPASQSKHQAQNQGQESSQQQDQRRMNTRDRQSREMEVDAAPNASLEQLFAPNPFRSVDFDNPQVNNDLFVHGNDNLQTISLKSSALAQIVASGGSVSAATGTLTHQGQELNAEELARRSFDSLETLQYRAWKEEVPLPRMTFKYTKEDQTNRSQSRPQPNNPRSSPSTPDQLKAIALHRLYRLPEDVELTDSDVKRFEKKYAALRPLLKAQTLVCKIEESDKLDPRFQSERRAAEQHSCILAYNNIQSHLFEVLAHVNSITARIHENLHSIKDRAEAMRFEEDGSSDQELNSPLVLDQVISSKIYAQNRVRSTKKRSHHQESSSLPVPTPSSSSRQQATLKNVAPSAPSSSTRPQQNQPEFQRSQNQTDRHHSQDVPQNQDFSSQSQPQVPSNKLNRRVNSDSTQVDQSHPHRSISGKTLPGTAKLQSSPELRDQQSEPQSDSVSPAAQGHNSYSEEEKEDTPQEGFNDVDINVENEGSERDENQMMDEDEEQEIEENGVEVNDNLDQKSTQAVNQMAILPELPQTEVPDLSFSSAAPKVDETPSSSFSATPTVKQGHPTLKFKSSQGQNDSFDIDEHGSSISLNTLPPSQNPRSSGQQPQARSPTDPKSTQVRGGSQVPGMDDDDDDDDEETDQLMNEAGKEDENINIYGKGQTQAMLKQSIPRPSTPNSTNNELPGFISTGANPRSWTPSQASSRDGTRFGSAVASSSTSVSSTRVPPDTPPTANDFQLDQNQESQLLVPSQKNKRAKIDSLNRIASTNAFNRQRNEDSDLERYVNLDGNDQEHEDERRVNESSKKRGRG